MKTPYAIFFILLPDVLARHYAARDIYTNPPPDEPDTATTPYDPNWVKRHTSGPPVVDRTSIPPIPITDLREVSHSDYVEYTLCKCPHKYGIRATLAFTVPDLQLVDTPPPPVYLETRCSFYEGDMNICFEKGFIVVEYGSSERKRKVFRGPQHRELQFSVMLPIQYVRETTPRRQYPKHFDATCAVKFFGKIAPAWEELGATGASNLIKISSSSLNWTRIRDYTTTTAK